METFIIGFTIFPITIVVLIRLLIVFWRISPNHQSFPFSFVALKVSYIKIASFIDFNTKTLPLIVHHFPLVYFPFGGYQHPYSVSFAIHYSANIYFSLIESHFGSSEFFHTFEGDFIKRKGLIGNKIFWYFFWFVLANLGQLSLSDRDFSIHLFECILAYSIILSLFLILCSNLIFFF